MPYAPGIQNRAGELLAQGISSAGQSIGNAIVDVAKQKKEDQSYAKMFDGSYDMLLQNGLLPKDITPDQLSVQQKAQYMRGAMGGLQLMQGLAQKKYQEARAAELMNPDPPFQPSTGQTPDGTKYFMSSPNSAQLMRDPKERPADPRFTKYQGPTVRFDQQTYGVWNPEKQIYDVQVAKAPGEKGFDPKTGYYERGGGTDISGFPQWRDPAALMGTPGSVRQAAPAAAKPLDAKAQAALDWARANPNDPRSAAILKKLGM